MFSFIFPASCPVLFAVVFPACTCRRSRTGIFLYILRCALRRSCGVLRVRVLWPAVPRAPVATTCHESVDFPCTGILPSYASPTRCWDDGRDLCRARGPALASPGMLIPLWRCGLRSTSPTTGRIGASARSSVIRPPLVCCPRVGSGMPASAATPSPMLRLGAGGVFVHGVAHCLVHGLGPAAGRGRGHPHCMRTRCTYVEDTRAFISRDRFAHLRIKSLFT